MSYSTKTRKHGTAKRIHPLLDNLYAHDDLVAAEGTWTPGQRFVGNDNAAGEAEDEEVGSLFDPM